MSFDGSTPQSERGNFGDSVPPPARLMITKMELENFKSYAGVKEIGPFHKCFSAVVGPNGSGKSNVIDAMLFVFGKRAKKLRLNKVSELIHKSESVRENPPAYARVSVFFQEIVDTGPGDEDFHLVPGTATVVSRIARQDNSSSYKIDDKTCQFKEVAKYLVNKGIDLDNNRFLILQGEVEMISMMPPKGKNEGDEGLLEYLEEIIGSNKFVDQITVVSEQLDALSETRQERLNRVKVVEKEKDSLESAKQEAESLLAKDREIQREKNVLFQINSMKAKTDIDIYQEQKTVAHRMLQSDRETLQLTIKRIKELEKDLKVQQRQYNTVNDELVKTKEEFAFYERSDIKLKEETKHLECHLKKLHDKLNQEVKKEKETKEKAQAALERIPVLRENIKDTVAQKAAEDSKLEELDEKRKVETQKLRMQLERKTSELAPLQQERAAFQANLDTAITKVQLLEAKTKLAKERLEQAENELSSIDESERKKRSEVANCEDDLIKCRDRIAVAEKEEALIMEKEGQLVKHYKKLISQVEETKAALQSRGLRRNPAIHGILQATKNGGPLSKAGVLGRLGDLATIDSEYDIAISTACGMLDHIVVQTTAGVQRCLEFLRQENLGRANFIPLDKMKKGAHDSSVQTPDGAPRLFELISPVSFAITPAIYLAVGNTLVARDLESATRWAYDYGKRWRVVTLDGNLIETAGTMTGGGAVARRGGMRLANSKVAKDSTVDCENDAISFKKLQQEAAQNQVLVAECRSARKLLVEEIKRLKAQVKVIDVKIPKLSMELSNFDRTRADLRDFIPQLKSQSVVSEEDAALLTSLNVEVSKCKTDMSSCASITAKLEAEVARLQKDILSAGGLQFKKQQATCDKCVSDIKAAEKELAAAQVMVTTNEKAAIKARKAMDLITTEIEQCSKSIADKKEELASLEKDAITVKHSFDQVKLLEEQRRSVLERLVKECEDLKKVQADFKCKEIEVLGQIEGIDKLLSDSEKRFEKWEDEIAKLHDQGENISNQMFDKEHIDCVIEAEADITTLCDVDIDLPKEGKNDLKRPSFRRLSEESLKGYDVNDIAQNIRLLESERAAIAKNANMGAISEYRKKEADYLARVEELENVTEQRNEARRKHDDLRKQRLEMFMEGFGQITLRLKEMYQMITLGGDAELELVDSLDPFAEGIVFSVRPPKKSWKNISNLSGGEKTLSSLALVFALHHFKPTPLYVMDEIDAALDFKNVSIVANYIKERTRNAQFIIISLRNNMFELADRLVGIYKTHNCTKSITIDPRAFGVQESKLPVGSCPRTPALSNRSNLLIKSASNITTLMQEKNRSTQNGSKVSFQSHPA